VFRVLFCPSVLILNLKIFQTSTFGERSRLQLFLSQVFVKYAEYGFTLSWIKKMHGRSLRSAYVNSIISVNFWALMRPSQTCQWALPTPYHVRAWFCGLFADDSPGGPFILWFSAHSTALICLTTSFHLNCHQLFGIISLLFSKPYW